MKSIFSAFTVLIPLFAFANDVQKDPILLEIVANEDGCVRNYADDKIYLNSDRIQSKNGLIYIDLNGREGIVVPYLRFDENGEYFIAAEISRNYCPLGHMTYRKDRKCYVEGCPYYCGNPSDVNKS